MKKSVLWMGKILLPTLLVLALSTVMVPAGTASPIPVIAQTNSTTTIFLDPPTKNGTVIGEEFNVSIMIHDAPDVQGWQVGLNFNATLLNCTRFEEGDFLRNAGSPYGTQLFNGTIDNTEGVFTRAYVCHILRSPPYASGDGRLAYATFKVKAPGVSDLHLQDVKVSKWEYMDTTVEKVTIPTNIIDVYTVIVNATTSHTVVTVSNSTGTDKVDIYGMLGVYLRSNFTGHAYNPTLKEISFNVTGPYPGFSNVTIPTDLLKADPPRVWTPIINGRRLGLEERDIADNNTHTSIYFTYGPGVNNVQITTRFMPSNISIALSKDSIPLEDSVTISGSVTAANGTALANVNVTIQYMKSGAETWTLLETETHSNGIYDYDWTPDETGTYKVKASWEGYKDVLGEESEEKTLKVKGAAVFPLMYVVAAVVAIIIIAAVVVYFVKIRKS